VVRKPWKCRLGWHKRVRQHGNADPNAKICLRCGKKYNIEAWAGDLPIGNPFGDP
jgi:hypothetical protein